MAGAMLRFSLVRLQYLDISGSFSEGASPGEWYWYRAGHYRIGITLHLACILPAGILMIWQFVPLIRHKALLFHRINGRTIITLTLLSNIGALMIARRAFDGLLATQGAVGTLAIATTTAQSLAYYNIKLLQIDQHRAWMLRAMVWFGAIITTRIIMIIAAMVISPIGTYYTTTTFCSEISFLSNGDRATVLARYPACAADPMRLSSGPNVTSLEVPVRANFGAAGAGGAEEI